MHTESVRLLKTLPQPCGYFADRSAQNLVIDAVNEDLPRVYEVALDHGYRRAGASIYRPACVSCSACVAVRVPVALFRPNRSQRRCQKRNADLQFADMPAHWDDETCDLFRRYVAQRHAGAGMDHADPDEFQRFFTGPWSPSRFFEFRLNRRLLAVAVTDITTRGLSAVYTFFEPDVSDRGLGTLCVLQQIAECARRNLPFLYLGYWIDGHPKMGYKNRFQPQQHLYGRRWTYANPPVLNPTNTEP